MKKYLQTATLTIGDPAEDQIKVINLRSVLNQGQSSTSKDLAILDFDFTVAKKRFDIHAQININLYNANDDTIARLTKKSGLSHFYNVAKIRCDAGYQGSNKLIFSGTVYNTITSYTPTGKVTSIQVSSYSENLITKKFSLTSRKGTTLKQALDQIAGLIGVNIDTAYLLSGDNKAIGQTNFQNGTVFQFLQNEAMNPNFIDPETKRCVFTIEGGNDALVISSLSHRVNQQPLEILQALNGLILTPTLTNENLVQCKALFNPDYQIRSYMTVRSTKFRQPEVSGEIYKLTHNFSYLGSTSTFELLPDGMTVPMNNIGINP